MCIFSTEMCKRDVFRSIAVHENIRDLITEDTEQLKVQS